MVFRLISYYVQTCTSSSVNGQAEALSTDQGESRDRGDTPRLRVDGDTIATTPK